MDLASFIQKRRPSWRQLEEVLRRIEGSGLRTLNEEQAVEFGRLYRSAASDLNQAQTFVTGDTTVRYLNNLVARCYLVIYSKNKANVWGAVRFLITGFPAVFRRYLGYFLLATAFFTVGTVLGFTVSFYDPEVGREFLFPENPHMIHPEDPEANQDPAASADQLAGFTGFLFRHNVSVTLVAFALGLTYGVGTAWLLFTTGVMMGSIGAMFLEANQFLAYATGILPHGVLEIPSCLLGGAGGFMLARAMIQARPWPRLEELARVGKQALLLVSGSVPLLAGAAFLEAVVARAPDRFLGSGFKLAVAGIITLLFLVYVLLLGWRMPAMAVEESRGTP